MVVGSRRRYSVAHEAVFGESLDTYQRFLRDWSILGGWWILDCYVKLFI